MNHDYAAPRTACTARPHTCERKFATARIALMSGPSIALTSVTRTILRISIYSDSEAVSLEVALDGLDLQPRDWSPPAAILSLGTEARAEVGEFQVSTARQPAAINIRRNQHQVQRLALDGDRLRFDLGASRLYGLGQGVPSAMNRRGGIYDMHPTHPRMGTLDHDGSSVAIPFIIGSEGWGLFVRAPQDCLFNLGGPGSEVGMEGMCERRGAAGWDLFLIDGSGHAAGIEPDLAEVVRGYYELTGRVPMLPKYAFGYQQSHRELRAGDVDFKQVTTDFFRDTGFPCDLLIYLSSGLAGASGWNTEMGSFDFNDAVFPDPAADLVRLRDANFRVALHTHQCPVDLHGTIDDADPPSEESAHAKNYWARHAAVLAAGPVDGWWPDGGDELSIESRLLRHQMYWQGSLEYAPDTRPFALHRTGYAGMTRWGGAVWSGDILSEWRTLRIQIHVGLNASVSFSPYWCTDVGGFISTKEYDGELFVRWFQYATFTPFLRAHGRPSWLHAPHGWSRFRPSEIPAERVESHYFASHDVLDEQVSPDPRVEPICRSFAELRYRLLPYIYNSAYQAHATGLPMMRPMWLVAGKERWCSTADDQYFFGDELLVAPVYHKGATARSVALPEGSWYGLLDGKSYGGGNHIMVDAPLGLLPVLVRAGSIIPVGDLLHYVGEPGHTDANGFDNLELWVYPGTDAELSLYEDDGVSLGYKRGVCTTTTIRWNDATQSLTAEGETSVVPAGERHISVKLMPGGEESQLACPYVRREARPAG